MPMRLPSIKYLAPLAAAATAAFFALSPDTKKSDDLSADTRNSVAAALASTPTSSASISHSTSPPSAAENPQFTSLPLTNFVAHFLAQSGDPEGAKFLINAYDKRIDSLLNSASSTRPHDMQALHRQVLQELGITDQEYHLYKRATDFHARMDIINNKDGIFDKISAPQPGVTYLGDGDQLGAISYGQLQAMMELFCEQARSPSGPNDPLFLQLLDMNNPQELQDFARSLYDYFAGLPRPNAYIRQALPYLKFQYGL